MNERVKKAYLNILEKEKIEFRRKQKRFTKDVLESFLDLWGMEHRLIDSPGNLTEIWVRTEENPHYCHLGTIKLHPEKAVTV